MNNDNSGLIGTEGMPQKAVTWRAVIVGSLAAITLGVIDPYSALWIQSSRFGVGACASGAFLMLILMIGVVQVALRAVRPRWAFAPGELITIFLMSVLAVGVTTRGFVAQLFPIITGATYYGDEHNGWVRTVLPHLPRWLFMLDTELVREFYEGRPQGAPIPWGAWLVPTFWWGLFMAAFYTATLCLMSMLRRQWVTRESVGYPIMRVGLDVIHEDGRAKRVNPLFKDAVFWIGFGLTFVVATVNALSRYYPNVVPIPLRWTMYSANRCFYLPLRIMPLMLAFGFLIPTRITFSLWFFWVFHVLERGVLRMTGVALETGLRPAVTTRAALYQFEATGAMVVLSAMVLWRARRHLMAVVRKALTNARDVDDSQELMSYRVALVGFLVGVGVMVVWLRLSGIPIWAIALLLGFFLGLHLAITQIIIRGGLPAASVAIKAQDLTLATAGSKLLGDSGMVALAGSLTWNVGTLAFFMAPAAHAFKLGSEIRHGRRRLPWVMALALALAFCTSVLACLWLSYREGALNTQSGYYSVFAKIPPKYAHHHVTYPTRPEGKAWWFAVGGGAVTWGLSVAQGRFVWWPLDPLGFVLSRVWIIDRFGFSIFLAWLLKSAFLRYGGAGLYRRAKPWFIGLVIGQISAAGLWFVVDCFTGMQKNAISLM